MILRMYLAPKNNNTVQTDENLDAPLTSLKLITPVEGTARYRSFSYTQPNLSIGLVGFAVNEILNQRQIDKIDTSTKEQIAEFKKTTEAQIKALEENTNRQIENYIKQTTEIVSKLEDNSILLAEILLRQLEEKLGELSGQLNNAQAKYSDLQGFKFLRSRQEREEQLTRQRNFIQRLEGAITYVRNKLNQVKSFLGGE